MSETVHTGTYVRLGTRVHSPIFATTGVIVEHDDAWNNRMRFDFPERNWNVAWMRADQFNRADGTPLQESDLTPIKGAGR